MMSFIMLLYLENFSGFLIVADGFLHMLINSVLQSLRSSAHVPAVTVAHELTYHHFENLKSK